MLPALLGIAVTATRADEPPAAEGPANREFAELFSDWEKRFAELNALRERYVEADAGEKERIEKRFDELVKQVGDLAPTMSKAARAAYEEAPNTNDDVTKMLIGMAGGACQRDNFEEAAELARVLIKHKCPSAELDKTAGTALFCTHDFATARPFLQRARDKGQLTREGEQYLSVCDDYQKFWEAEQALRAKEAAADDLPRVKLATTAGDIVLELFENEAPQAVGNFVHLVEKGFYDEVAFHRVLPHFMAQGGCPDGIGTGGPGYRIYCECYQANHRKHFRGSLSMAHAGKNTGGSQFFLTFVPTSHLNGRHTVFGRVIEGMDVLAQLQRRDPSARGPLPDPDKITKATVVRKRDHEYAPTKVE
jgi:cyclophilin family peptidyl-prolyl cis-trans isomerase